MMVKIFYVGLGGFCGAVFRYLGSGLVDRIFENSILPLGTIAVNVVGCLGIGFLGGIADSKEIFTSTARLFLFVGLLGGFTTFSTFKYEIFNLFQSGQAAAALGNAAIQLLLGFGAVWVGVLLSRGV